MRPSLENLIRNTIVLRYQLPCNIAGTLISRTHISTENDNCLFQVGKNDDIANIIYNGIVEYAFNDNEIDLTKLDALQIRALQSKLKYNPNAQREHQLGYGFQGETMLHLLLEYLYRASKAIARGYMFSALENAETKGYDSYLMVEDGDVVYMYFGEAKFYISGYKESIKMIFENIDKALSDDYLNRNFIAMDNQYEHINQDSRITRIIDAWRVNPSINMAVEAHKYNMHLVYPMLVIFDDKAKPYDDIIVEVLNHISQKYGTIKPTLTIPCSIFFIFLPVNDSRAIKTQVLEWIRQKQPLMQ